MRASDGVGLITDADVGARLRRARQEAELSQADVARRLGIIGVPFHQTQVGRVEAGERPLRVVELVAFARVLDVAPAWLLGEGDLERPAIPGPALAAALAALDTLNATFRAQAVEREAAGDDPDEREA